MENVTSSAVGKWTLFAIGAVLVFSLVFSGLGNNLRGRNGANGQAAASGEETIATVNGNAITRGDYEQHEESLRNQAQQFGQTIGVLQTAQLHAAALDQLITAKLGLQQAKKLGLTVSDAEIQKERVQEVTQAGVAATLGLKPNASLSDIDAARAKNGLSSMEVALPDEAVREKLLLDKLQTYETNKVVVTEGDARLSYRQWHTRHILIDNKKRSDVQAQSQAQQILTKAKATGADFAALAKQYSEDPGTKGKGGDDGWIDQNTSYVPEFKTAAFALKPGGITLAKSPQYGYFIIKLDAVRDNLPKDFEKTKAKYIADAKQQKQNQFMQEFITSMKNAPNTKVVVNDPQLRADRAVGQAAQESDKAKQQAAYRAALADYNKALSAKPLMSVAGEINVQIGQVYQALGQGPQAITAYEAAIQNTDDPNLRMQLGNLYVQAKQPSKAVTQFQAASQQAWDDQNLHQQLIGTYLTMKRPDLVKQEMAWLKQYQQSQQASAPGGTMPGAMPITVPPAAASSSSAPAPSAAAPVKNVPGTGVDVVPSDAPGAATVVPTQKKP